MSISNKIFVAVIAIIFIVALAGALSSIKNSKRAANMLFSNITTSLQKMETKLEGSFKELQTSQGKYILNLAEVAAGDSLLPGEEKKFKFIANQIASLKGIEEFTFYNMSGIASLSSNIKEEGKKLDSNLIKKGEESKEPFL